MRAFAFPPARRAPGARGGFTLLEVMVALVILGFVVLSAQASMTSMMVRDVSWQEQRTRATQLAMDRVHAIQSAPVYSTLAASFAETNTAIPGGYTRTTRFIATTFADGSSYQTVTVTVTGRRLPKPVTRTTVVASP